MNPNARIFFMLLLTLIFCSTYLYAQHDHGSTRETHINQPPHGGVMNNIGKYHIEMLVNMFLKEDKLTFYLYKGNFKPVLTEHITGTIIFQQKDGTSITDTLQAKGDYYFVAQLKSSDPFQCSVHLLIKEKVISTLFNHAGLGHKSSNIYSCPMHPQIKNSNPGTCPKCKMNLEKQK